MRFNRAAFEYIQAAIQRTSTSPLQPLTEAGLATVRLQPDEREWLKSNYPIFTQTFLDQLEAFRFQPAEQIDLRFESDDGEWGYVALDIKGKWAETILYEVRLRRSCPAHPPGARHGHHFRSLLPARRHELGSDWPARYGEVDRARLNCAELARTKAKRLTDAGIVFSEFGTRRRRSYRAHDLVMRGLVEGAKAAREAGGKGALMGTSNVHFAHKYGLKAIGTIAHVRATVRDDGRLGAGVDHGHRGAQRLSWVQRSGDEQVGECAQTQTCDRT